MEFLVERFGYETLKTVLADRAKGEQINAAPDPDRGAAPLAEIEKEFRVFARKRAEDLAPDVDWEQPEKGQLDTTDRQALAEWLAKYPNNFCALTLYAKNLLADRKWEDAKEPLKKLIVLYPQYAGPSNPETVILLRDWYAVCYSNSNSNSRISINIRIRNS